MGMSRRFIGLVSLLLQSFQGTTTTRKGFARYYKGQEMGSDDGGGSLVVGLHTPQQQRKSPSPTTFTTEPLSYYGAVKASSVPSLQSYFIRLSLSYSGRSGVIAARPGRWI
jgi:hypothetical protein